MENNAKVVNETEEKNIFSDAIVRTGDKVKFNSKYSEFEQYKDRTFTVRNVGVVCGTPSVWLRGIAGCVALDAVDITEKLSDYESLSGICIKIS